MTLRRILVQAHLWLGLTIGLVWALQGLTGALLVFHREFDRLTISAVAGPMASADAIVARAEAAAGAPIRVLSVADARGDVLNAAYEAADGGDRVLRVEAATGRVLDDRDAESGWRRLYHLHEELLLHDRGKTLIGISGLLLFSTALTGLWLGWPRGRTWRSAFGPAAWRTLRQRLFGWHRMSGLLVAVALIAIPLGGAAMAFGSSLRPFLARTAGLQLPYKADGGLPERIIAPGRALAQALALYPNARFVRLTMPNEKTPVFSIRLLQPGEVRAWSGTTTVTVDPANGRVLAVYDALRAPLANRLYDAAFPLHNGELGGLFGRIGVMLAGLSLPALYVTGVLAWLRKRRARGINRPASSPSSSPETSRPTPA